MRCDANEKQTFPFKQILKQKLKTQEKRIGMREMSFNNDVEFYIMYKCHWIGYRTYLLQCPVKTSSEQKTQIIISDTHACVIPAALLLISSSCPV